MSKQYPAVYRIVCQATDECYVGSSAYVQSRKSDHWQKLYKNGHANIHLQRAFNKYGQESFIFEVLERPSIAKLIEREQYWIDALNPAYNIRKVAESNLGLKKSESARAKRRQAWRNASPEEQERAKRILAEGRQKRTEMVANGEWEHSPEAIEKIKQARARQEMTPAMLNALKQGQEIRKQVNPKPRQGMKNSEETQRKQSLSALARPERPREIIDRINAKNRGRKQPEEERRRRGEAMRGHTVSDEARRKSSEKQKAAWASLTDEERQAIIDKRNAGRKSISDETRRRMSEAKKRKQLNSEQPPLFP